MKPILIEISPGELMDRISILKLKLQHQQDKRTREILRGELRLLRKFVRQLPRRHGVATIFGALASVNRRLWSIEDKLRSCEADIDFGDGFIQFARAVYKLNDERARIRTKINRLLGVTSTDHKIYLTKSSRLTAARTE